MTNVYKVCYQEKGKEERIWGHYRSRNLAQQIARGLVEDGIEKASVSRVENTSLVE